MEALDSFAGTGNPHLLGAMPEGAKVIDIGCGAGFDVFIAARSVGPTGFVVGVDMTAEMLARARSWSSSVDNVDIRLGFAEELPVEDDWADVIISNGVFNLCPDKPKVLAEVYRALRPGGWMQFGDVLVQKQVSEEAKRDIDLWSG